MKSRNGIINLSFMIIICMIISFGLICSPSVAQESGQTDYPTLTIVQEAEGGKFESGENNSFTLTLDNPLPYSSYFAEDGMFEAGLMNTSYVSELVTEQKTIPGAIVVSDQAEDSDVMMIDIENLTADGNTGNLIVTGHIDDSYTGKGLSALQSRKDRAIPAEFNTQAKLYMDPMNEDDTTSWCKAACYATAIICHGSCGHFKAKEKCSVMCARDFQSCMSKC